MNHPLSKALLAEKLSPGKSALITGTLLLTFTGLLCRFLGFFYRIYMSRAIGAEGLGIYNMVHTLFNVSFALCAGSIQTALSQYVAAHRERGRSIFRTGLVLALGLSALIAWFLTGQSSFLAGRLLLEPRCAPYIPLIACSVPFAALHACICGYYYGMQKARIPALSQVAEQLLRMAVVFLIADFTLKSGREITVSLAVMGHLAGEAAAALFVFVCLLLFPPDKKREKSFSPAFFPLFNLALPLMGSRLILNLLGSAEAALIPNRLAKFGLTGSEALSVYGVLTSMALPFVLFPSAITNSMAVLLLPTVSKAQAESDENRISTIISLSLSCSCYMGILCVGLFTIYGESLGTAVFEDSRAGVFITILSWLCPFMYVATTMGSILNGLGKTSLTFLFNTMAMSIRLGFVIFAIPSLGIYGYLAGMLIGELILALLCFLAVKWQVDFRWNALFLLVKPILLLLLAAGILLACAPFKGLLSPLPPLLNTLIQMGFLTGCYCGLVFLFRR